MPLALAVLLPLLAQVGPVGTPIPAPLEIPRKRTQAAAPSALPEPPKRFGECLDAAAAATDDALKTAQAWQQAAKGAERSWAAQCLGNAYNFLGRWADAEGAFLAARDAAPVDLPARRAALGAMAGRAAFDAGAHERSDAALLQAHSDALRTGRASLSGSLAIQRALPLVALKREAEAAKVLEEGRRTAPEDPQGWLLSATLARRQGDLKQAQTWIEKAADLLPEDPEIGLEAGVIAVLSGREDAARKSWQSVIAVSPESEFARRAQSYLDQLGAAAAPSAQ